MGFEIASMTNRGFRRVVGAGAVVVLSGSALVASGAVGATTLHKPLRSLENLQLNAPVVGTAMTPSGLGYWLVARDGGVFSLGSANFYGSVPGRKLGVSDVIGMVPTATGHGYWVFASDGGVFSFGDAHYFGSAKRELTDPIVDMTISPTGKGYALIDSAGKVYAFGDMATAKGTPAPAARPGKVARKINRKLERKVARKGTHVRIKKHG